MVEYFDVLFSYIRLSSKLRYTLNARVNRKKIVLIK